MVTKLSDKFRHPLLRQKCDAITVLLNINSSTRALIYTLWAGVFPVCNELCDTPTWSNQTTEGMRDRPRIQHPH